MGYKKMLTFEERYTKKQLKNKVTFEKIRKKLRVGYVFYDSNLMTTCVIVGFLNHSIAYADMEIVESGILSRFENIFFLDVSEFIFYSSEKNKKESLIPLGYSDELRLEVIKNKLINKHLNDLNLDIEDSVFDNILHRSLKQRVKDFICVFCLFLMLVVALGGLIGLLYFLITLNFRYVLCDFVLTVLAEMLLVNQSYLMLGE